MNTKHTLTMKTQIAMPHSANWHFSLAAQEAAHAIPDGTISAESHALGLRHAEPLIIGMDALYQYAATYGAIYGGKLADDSVLGPEWLNAAKGFRGLLNGDGAVAMQHRRTTDSKDNGAIESLFWAALEIAGFTEKDL